MNPSIAAAPVQTATLVLLALATACTGGADDPFDPTDSENASNACISGCDLVYGPDDTCTGTKGDEWGSHDTVASCYADCEDNNNPAVFECADDYTACDAALANCGDGVTYSVSIDGTPPSVLTVRDRVSLSASGEASNGSDTELTWETSNPNIATITSQGSLQAVAPGRVLVTARVTGTAEAEAPTSDEDTHEIEVVDGCAEPEVLGAPAFEYEEINNFPVTVGEGDCLTSTDAYARVFELNFERAGGRQYELSGFDDRARMLLYDANGNLLREESASQVGEQVTFRKTMQIGTYTLWVTTATPRTETAMTLSVIDTCRDNESQPAYMGQPRSGSFVDGDCYTNGRYHREIPWELDDPDGNIRLTVDINTPVWLHFALRARWYGEGGFINSTPLGQTRGVLEDFLYDDNYTLELTSEEPVEYTVEFDRY